MHAIASQFSFHLYIQKKKKKSHFSALRMQYIIILKHHLKDAKIIITQMYCDVRDRFVYARTIFKIIKLHKNKYSNIWESCEAMTSPQLTITFI